MSPPIATQTPCLSIQKIGRLSNGTDEGLTLSFTDYEFEGELDTPKHEKFRNRKHSDHRQSANKRIARPPRRERDQAFKCVHCKQFIGAPVAGGRHRNHCPNCLWSRHVDDSYPGDRRSKCHAAMEPVGRLVRRNGEQVLVHQCRACGKHDPNRVAADDSPLLLMRLPLIDMVSTGEHSLEEKFA